VDAFLTRGLRWADIAGVVAETLEGWQDEHIDQVDAVLAADAAARARARKIVARRLAR
jgi:1-deoxy-D-xylulose 5-phosphate reductoisomerase